MTRDELVAFIQRLIDEWFHRRNVSAASEFYADDAVVESPTAGRLVGVEAIAQVTEAWLTAFPDLVVTIDDVLVDGNRAVVSARFSGTHANPFLGMSPTGKPFELPILWLMTVEGSRIVHERRVYDFSGFLIRIGILKVKPS